MKPEVINKVTSICIKLFEDKKEYKLPEEYNYSHLPLCVIDAVFSIGVRYESVKKTINRFCDYFKIEKFSGREELSITDFLKLMQTITINDLTEKVYYNRQRTSSKNGILKSEAVIKFLKILHDNKIETFNDIHNYASDNLENEIKKLPGQKSGISYTYFLMLSGSEDMVKPDRWIIGFLESIIGTKINAKDCQFVIKEVVKQMNNKGFKLNSRKLDYLIWNFQRKNSKNDTAITFNYKQKDSMSIFDQIKEILQNKKKGFIFSSSHIKEELKSKFGTNPNSVLLTDFCYNRCNNGIKFNKHIFEYCGRDKYKYLGENIPYNGLIFHKPINEKKEKIIGEWINGKKNIYPI